MEEVYSPAQNAGFWHHLSKIPNYIAPSVTAVDYDRLFAQGIRHLVFDLDNTLATFGATTVDPQMKSFLLSLKSRPQVVSLRIATNSLQNLAALRQALGVPVIQSSPLSFKPLPTFYRRVLRGISAEPGAVAMIGDKLIQDVWGANFAGMTTILVQPVGRDNFFDRVLHVRTHERRLLRKYLPKHLETWF